MNNLITLGAAAALSGDSQLQHVSEANVEAAITTIFKTFQL